MMYSGEMVWFVGVVEDRDDPLEMGRLKVRCFGIHDTTKEELPSDDLPWAHMMLPANSAGTGSIGQSATGIVEGAWVVGFFTDGKNMQEPLVMGVLPSSPNTLSKDGTYSDGTGIHPIFNTETDQPLHARSSTFEQDSSYVARENNKVEEVECAIPPKTPTVVEDEEDEYYDRPTWSYPDPHEGNSPIYPYNKVTQSESGHVLEVDDTPGATRIAQFHNTGTNYEMLHSGDMATTVVGDNYSVTIKNDNMYVKGNLNITVEGDMRTLVKGNYHLEVDGNKTEKINNGSRSSKISNSEFTEIGQEFSSNVNIDYIQRIGGQEIRIVDSDRTTTISGNDIRRVNIDSQVAIFGKHREFIAKNHSTTSGGTMSIVSNKNMTIETAENQITNIEGYHDLNVTGESRQDASNIWLNDGDNSVAPGAARIGDTADTGDAGGGSHFDVNAPGTDVIETGSGTVFIGD